VISRRYHEAWDFDETALAEAAARLDRLRSRAGGHGAGDEAAAAAEIGRALLDELDVPTALDVAEEAGGDVLRELAATLGLRSREAWW
jgi:cysteinyl-tRNA synthetase